MDPRYSNYPRANVGVGGSTMSQRPPGAHFEFISEAFALIRADLGTWIVTAILTIVVSYAVSFPLSFLSVLLSGGGAVNPYGGINPLGIVFQVVSTSLTWAVGALFIVGQGMMGLRAARGEKVQIGDLFAPFRLFIPVFITSLILSFMVLLGLTLLVVPGIIAAGLFVLAPFAAYDQQLSPGDALRWCTENCKDHLWSIAWVGFCASFVSGLGICLCGVGYFFTAPIFAITLGLTYGTFRNAPSAPFMPYPPSGPVGSPTGGYAPTPPTERPSAPPQSPYAAPPSPSAPSATWETPTVPGAVEPVPPTSPSTEPPIADSSSSSSAMTDSNSGRAEEPYPYEGLSEIEGNETKYEGYEPPTTPPSTPPQTPPNTPPPAGL